MATVLNYRIANTLELFLLNGLNSFLIVLAFSRSPVDENLLKTKPYKLDRKIVTLRMWIDITLMAIYQSVVLILMVLCWPLDWDQYTPRVVT